MLWLSRYTHSFVASFPTIRQKLLKGYSALSISTLCRYYGLPPFDIRAFAVARYSLLPTPCSLLPAPYSLLPALRDTVPISHAALEAHPYLRRNPVQRLAGPAPS